MATQMDERTLDIVLDVKVKVTVQLGSCQLPMREYSRWRRGPLCN